MLAGADDGRNKRQAVTPIEADALLACGYSYVALGGMHARVELRGTSDKAAAAYASTPQCLDWDARGPGGFMTGVLAPDGAELAFHQTARHQWKVRELVFPPPHSEQYPAKLDGVLESLNNDLRRTDLLRVILAGEVAALIRQLSEQRTHRRRDDGKGAKR